MSCRRAISASRQHARVVQVTGHSRRISYTSHERQKSSLRALSNPDDLGDLINNSATKHQDGSDKLHADAPPIGRYSREPLTPGGLLTQLRDVNSSVAKEARSYSSERPMATINERTNKIAPALSAQNATATAVSSAPQAVYNTEVPLDDEPSANEVEHNKKLPIPGEKLPLDSIEQLAAENDISLDNQVTARDHKTASTQRGTNPDAKHTGFAYMLMKQAGVAAKTNNAEMADHLLDGVVQHITERNPNDETKTQLCDAIVLMYARMRLFKRAVQVMNWIQGEGMYISPKAWTSLIRSTANVDDKSLVDTVWEIMLRRGITPDAFAWSARILALLQHNRTRDALEAMDKMAKDWTDYNTAAVRATSGPRSATARPRMSSSSESSRSETTQHILPSVAPARPTTAVANSALSALIRNRSPERAVRHIQTVLQWMKAQQLKYDIDTYNVLIKYAALNGNLNEIFLLLQKLKDEGIRPDAETGTVLLSAVFEGDHLADLNPDEQTSRVLEIIDDIEQNHIAADIDKKGYAIAIDRMLKLYNNRKAAELLMARMRRKNITITPHIYTVLLDNVLSGSKPDIAAFEALWLNIKYKDGVWRFVDSYFFDRALERLCHYHEFVGIDKILEILNYTPQRKIRPSWPALLEVAKVFRQRGENVRLQKLISNLRSSKYVMPHDETRGHGHGSFWEYIFSTGILQQEGINTYREMWQIDRERKQKERPRAAMLL